MAVSHIYGSMLKYDKTVRCKQCWSNVKHENTLLLLYNETTINLKENLSYKRSCNRKRILRTMTNLVECKGLSIKPTSAVTLNELLTVKGINVSPKY